MDVKTSLKARLPSRHVTEGAERAPRLAVADRSVAENLKSVKWNPEQDVVRSADEPLSATGGVAGLTGNFAPGGALVKVAGMASLKFSGPARVFDGKGACFAAVRTRNHREGSELVIRGYCVGHVEPEAAIGGPTGLLRDGDVIELDALAGTLNVRLSGEEIERRRRNRKPREGNEFGSDYAWKYARQVGPALNSAVKHPGGAAEKSCYADI